MRNNRQAANSARQVITAIIVYVTLMLSITGLSWAVYRHTGDSYQRPLFDQNDRFADLTNYYGKTQNLHYAAASLGSGGPVFNYPAPAAFVYKTLLYLVPGHKILPFLGFLAASALLFGFLNLGACRGPTAVRLAAAVAILVTITLSDPLWFDADRGNIEGIAWVFTAAGLCFLLRSRYRLAAVLIGLSAAVKPYPILFLLLLIGRRKYKEAVLGLVTAASVTLAALIYLGPNPVAAYRDLQPGVLRYLAYYVNTLLPITESRFGHSILDGMKSAALVFKMHGFHTHLAEFELTKLRIMPGGWPAIPILVQVYPLLAVAGLGFIFLAFRKAPLLNQITAIAVAIVILPPASTEYTLLSLYVPFGACLVFFTREIASGRVTLRYPTIIGLATIYALLFAPTTLLLAYAGDAKLLLLIALLVITARTPMPSAYFGDQTSAISSEAHRPTTPVASLS